jgi:membrane protease YdiL (CAAX protease family)
VLKRSSLLKGAGFTVVAIGLVASAGPIVGIAAAIAGLSSVPPAAYGAVVSALLFAATGLALHWEGLDLRNLGLVPTRDRIRELSIGFAVGVLLFGILALVRGTFAGVTWTFGGWQATLPVLASLIVALLLLLPEELLFRGYAFQRLIQTLGVWPGILISAVLFGLYHLAGPGMWGIGAFFRAAMPALGGVVFGWLAVRTRGLALPIGLHLGGNWVQGAVFSFRAGPDTGSAAAWTAYVTESQQWALYGPDLASHLPFIVTMFLAVVVLRGASGPRQRSA